MDTTTRLRNLGLTAAIVIALMGFALTAQAFDCTDDGVGGHYNGTSADDAGCITEAEYVAMTSPSALLDAGLITSIIDNGDGTVTVAYALGGVGVLIVDPLDRPVAATPRFEPDAPTVREVLFPYAAGFSLLPA